MVDELGAVVQVGLLGAGPPAQQNPLGRIGQPDLLVASSQTQTRQGLGVQLLEQLSPRLVLPPRLPLLPLGLDGRLPLEALLLSKPLQLLLLGLDLDVLVALKTRGFG